MDTTLILSAVFSILQIVGLILLLVVLIKQFKHGGGRLFGAGSNIKV
jgi:hypothetical protein